MNSFTHIPVLLIEVLAALQPRPGMHILDGTIGGAGHAAAILERISPRGSLTGIDRDGTALQAARLRLAPFPGSYELHHGTFDQMERWAAPASLDGILLDLGVSSPQLDHAERGFSFLSEGPLDMRMDPSQPTTAQDLVNTLPVEDLHRIFADLGEEPRARRIAQLIVQERLVQPLTSTRQLADLVERAAPRHGARTHPATRVFQALRIHLNDELGQLDRALHAATRLLRPSGRLAVISFHSLEARAVKRFGQARCRDYEFDGEVDIPELRRPKNPDFRWVSRRAITASPAEILDNPRSRSAQLRVLEKT